MTSERVIMSSTTSTSLNDRFTRMMKTRRTQVSDSSRPIRIDDRGVHPTVARIRSSASRQPRSVLVGGFKYPTQGRVHSVARYANSRRPSVHHRVGRKNFPERIPFARRMNGRVQKKRQSFWDRSEQRQDNYRVENRYRREGRFVNPLDRFTQAPQRGYGYRMRPGNRQAQGFRYNRYNNNNNRMNGNYGRTNRRALDRELDGYMQKSARYNRARLDEDMDKYMSGTKAYLDKQMDEYMSAKKKNTAIQGM